MQTNRTIHMAGQITEEKTGQNCSQSSYQSANQNLCQNQCQDPYQDPYQNHYQRSYQTLWAKKLPKQTLRNFWEQFQEDKLNSILFYDGEPATFSDFCAWLLAKDKDARFIASEQGEIKALYWLNNPVGKSVMIHFCFLRHAFCEQEEIGLYVVKSLLFSKDRQGEYVVSALFGLTPKPYRHALAFIQKLGFHLAAELPKACYFAQKNIYKNGIFSILTRDKIPQ